MESLIPIQLRSARTRKRLTLDRVAIEAGMASQHISAIETGGKRGTQLISIERIAKALGLSLVLVPEHLESEVASFIQSRARVPRSGETDVE